MLIKTELAHRLRQGEVDRLESDDLDAVLGWITRAQREPAASLASVLGDPGSDSVLLRRVYEQLDRILFVDGILKEDVAGVSKALAEGHRRGRYRRLMAAFHPDRYPDPELAEWLTTRSQAIHRAYERFRRGDVSDTTPAIRPQPAAAATVRRPPKRRIPRVSFGPGLIHLLRNRVREIQHLEAKILGALAVLFFLPVLILYLNQYSVTAEYGVTPSSGSKPGLESADAESAKGAPDPSVLVPAELEQRLAALEDPPDGLDSEVMSRPPDFQEPVVERLATKVGSERIAAREAIARLTAAREIAAIEAAAVVAAARRMAEREDQVMASMAPDHDPAGVTKPASDVGIPHGASGGADGPASGLADFRRDGTESVAAAGNTDEWGHGIFERISDPSLAPEASLLEVAARDAASLEAAARRAAEKEAAALEAAMRETAALEQAMREAAALKAAAKQAAEREAAMREAAAREEAMVIPAQRSTKPLVNERNEAIGEPRLAWVADAEREVGSVTRRPNARERVPNDAEAMAIGQRRVAALLDSYQSAFKHGDIAGLMRHLGPDPRENSNRGRSWFEASFVNLLERSRWRQLHVDIGSIVPSGDGDWEISGHFELRVDYMDRPPVQASGPVHYRVSNRNDGWRIDSIDY